MPASGIKWLARGGPHGGDDVRPSAVIVLDALRGGYLPERGFDPESRQAVEPVAVQSRTPDAFDRDPLSTGYGKWIPLVDHLVETETAARTLMDRFGADIDLTAPQRDAIAARGGASRPRQGAPDVSDIAGQGES